MAEAHTYKMPYLTAASLKALTSYGMRLIEFGKGFTGVRNRMDMIDEAYARYTLGIYGQNTSGLNARDGKDRVANQSCDIMDQIVSPIVVSQVDTLHAYLCDTYLSGYPIFPVASTYSDRAQAEIIEAVIDDHATVDRYARSIKLALLDAVKYNFAALETSWAPVHSSEVQFDATAAQEQDTRKTKRDYLHINRLKRINARNAFWDTIVLPCEIAADGEFFGYSERMTRIQLLRYMQYLHNEGYTNQALKKAALDTSYANDLWNEDPLINTYLQERNDKHGVNWSDFWDDTEGGLKRDVRLPRNGENLYIKTRIYCRVVPSEFNLTVPHRETVQIWILEFINGTQLISARPYNSPNDEFPVAVGQSIEDGLGLQTQSPAEKNIALQEMVSFLMRARISGTRRSLGDRAIYDPEVIHPDDMNNPSSTSKIPARAVGLLNRDIRTAYYQIPFENNGTLGAVQDAMMLTQYSKELDGTNNATNGQFQKGNKSVQEFSTVMSNAENRMRLLALNLELAIFMPTKATLKHNLLSYGKDTAVTSPKTGKKFEISMQQIIEAGFAFKIADGYTPKSKLASTEILTAGLNTISTNQILAQQLGGMLSPMFIHLMSLAGLQGIEEYMPQQQPQQQLPPTEQVPE